MEIPVRMIQEKIAENIFEKTHGQVQLQQVIEPNYFSKNEGTLLDVTVLPRQQSWTSTGLENTFSNKCQIMNDEETLKHWFTTVELEENLLKHCLYNKNVSCLISKVDPILRVVVIKVKKSRKDITLVTPFKRIICLPEHVDITSTKVSFCPERKVIVVKAPFSRRQGIQHLEQRLEQSLLTQEYEPSIYKMLKHLRRVVPRFMTPRCIRDVETGLWKLCLDVHCSGFLPEEMEVALKSMERVLVFKALRNLHENEQLRRLQTLGFFPRSFYHELTVPSWIKTEKITWFKLRNDTLRVHLPICKQTFEEKCKIFSIKKTPFNYEF